MNYPKPVMTISELGEMGFNKRILSRYVHTPGQKFAFRDGDGSKGNIFIDTEEFDKWRLKHCIVNN